MADDITLTVRVRDLTRGDFASLRGRMQGLGGDIRRLSRDSGMASERAQRLGDELNGVSGRMAQLQRNGRLANSEMTFMRRTMSLLGRDLNNARRAGEITGDEFGVLSRQLDETRLGFDRLARDVERHNSVAQRAARDEQRRQQQAQRNGQLQARALREDARRRADALNRIQRLGQLQARAEREDAQRDEQRRARIQRMGAIQARALREDEERIRRLGQLQAQAQRMDEERTARMVRQRQQAQRQGVTRLTGAGDDDLSARFRSMGDRDVNRVTQGVTRLSDALNGVTGSSDRARRNVRALNDDLQVMSRLLQDAQRSGNLSRREFNALSNGLRLASAGMRDLRRSGDLSRSTIRAVRDETNLLQARLRLLGQQGSRIDRMSDRFLVLQHRLRDSRDHLGRFRSALNRVGESGLAGMRPVLMGLSMLGRGFSRVRGLIQGASHGMKMFMLILGLIGPLAAPVGAILATALGGAFVALGAFALRSEVTVRAAFSRMKKTIGETMRESAQPLRSALVGGMRDAGAAVKGLQSQLTAAFSATAPLVKDLVGAITDFIARALPGITKALQSMGPVMAGFRDAMGSIGAGIGEMFAAMTSGGGAEGLRNSWKVMGDEIRRLLVNIGQFINSMSQSESATALLVGMLRTLSGILIIIEGAFAAVDNTLVPLIDKFNELGVDSPTGLESLGKVLDVLGISSADATGSFVRFRDANEASADAANKNTEAIQALKDAISGFNDINIGYFEAQTKAAESVDKLTKSFEENGKTLALETEEGLKNRTAMADLARAYGTLVESADKANIPLSKVKEQTDAIRTSMIEQATAALGSKSAAEEYVNTLLGTPKSVETLYKLQKDEALSGLRGLRAELEANPDKKFITVSALTSEAISALNAVGFKTETLPNGRTKVFTDPKGALGPIAAVKAALAVLDGTTAETFTRHTINYHYTYTQAKRPGDGATFLGPSGRYADGGVVSFFADGGRMGENHVAQIAPAGSWRVWGEPETGGESYIPLAPTKRPRSRMIAEETVDRLGGQIEWFAKGGSKKKETAAQKRAKAEKEARKDVIGELTISHFGKMAGYKNAELSSQLGKANGLGSLVDDLNKWRAAIRKTTHGGLENSLLKKLDKAGRALIGYEKKHALVAKQLDKAKASLSALKESAKAMRESVRTGVLSATNITQVASGDKPVTLSAVLSQMRQGVDKSSAFSQALKDLQARGVSRTIIEQIAEAGISGGGLETAGALLTASDSQIQGINEMQAKIDASASAAGKTASDAMYAAGIKAAEGMVKGLEKKQKSIEKAMMSIAKSMEKAIKKALGIKSPSKVMEKVGHFTAEGFAVGLEKNHKPHQAVESMLAVRPSSGSSGGSSSGGAQIIQIRIGDRVLDEIILDSNRRTVRSRGGNVQAVFSPSRR